MSAIRETEASSRGDRARRVVVLGGGFAGVSAARSLTRMLGRRGDVQVELLSEENYFVFQPLLPEVAAGSINPNHVVNPIRELIPKVRFRWCRVSGVDCMRKVVTVMQGEGRQLLEIGYDHLVFALGKISDVSSMPGVENHGLAMKNLGDAFRLRNHVLRCLELADISDDPGEKSALLTFVVAGAGLSGVETIGELSEMLRRCIASFGNIDAEEVRFVLILAHDRVLPEMAASLGRSAEAILRKRKIEMIVNARIRAATRHGVYLSIGRFVPTRTLVCTVGNVANPVVRSLIDAGGFVEGRFRGRGIGVLATDATLQCVGKPGHWAVGDNAGVPDPEDAETLCPPTAQFAVRQAKTCARNILATVDDRPLTPFHHRNMGMLASLGRRSGVADVLGIHFTGFPAWIAWRSFYWSQLPGLARKTSVMLDWMLALFFPRDIAQIRAADADRLRVDHYEAGETIFEQHEIGREAFIVQSGEVEIIHPGGPDAPEVPVAVLGKGEVFGEMALLEDRRRNAGARARSPVDLLVIPRDGFSALVHQFPVLDQYFRGLMNERHGREMR
jgi:NADH dehydrogenase